MITKITNTELLSNAKKLGVLIGSTDKTTTHSGWRLYFYEDMIFATCMIDGFICGDMIDDYDLSTYIGEVGAEVAKHVLQTLRFKPENEEYVKMVTYTKDDVLLKLTKTQYETLMQELSDLRGYRDDDDYYSDHSSTIEAEIEGQAMDQL